MDSKVAVMSIIVKDGKATDRINDMLHSYRDYIIGRMGIPYKEKNICIISIALDAPADIISALAGKIGNIQDVSVKTAISAE